MAEQVLPPVARNINLPCKKCGVDRFFVVLAHLTPESAKVKCEVCGAQKTYKLPKAQAAKKSTAGKSTATRTSRTKTPDYSAMWNELREKIGVETVLPYNMRMKFGANIAIEHPKFGIGFVTVSTPEKIEVTFQEGGRSLVHNRG